MSDIVTGYKATNANMVCRNHQFVLGKWYQVEGDLELCGNGFHFCKHPSGVWSYYSAADTRVFKCEAREVLEAPETPGADYKLVCREIRLVEEVTPGLNGEGYRNTGDHNTGDGNTGDHNTGYGNTGYGNTGYRNTGYRNTGNRNTGDGNAADYCSGFFCVDEPYVRCFDTQTDMTHAEFRRRYPEYWDLCEALAGEDEIEFETYKDLPGITPEKLAALHAKHRGQRNAHS